MPALPDAPLKRLPRTAPPAASCPCRSLRLRASGSGWPPASAVLVPRACLAQRLPGLETRAAHAARLGQGPQYLDWAALAEEVRPTDAQLALCCLFSNRHAPARPDLIQHCLIPPACGYSAEGAHSAWHGATGQTRSIVKTGAGGLALSATPHPPVSNQAQTVTRRRCAAGTTRSGGWRAQRRSWASRSWR